MNVFYFWKIWLWINKSKTNTSEVLTVEIPTKRILITNKDIAERLSTEGIEVNYSMLTYIIDQYDRVVRDMISAGYSVKTNNVLFTPSLTGEWSMENLEYDPEKHQISVHCELTEDMKRVVNFTGVKVLGFKDASSYVSQITDITSGEIDSVVTRNGNIIIEGKDIKALNKEGTTTNCVFLQKNDKTIVDVSNEISINERDRIVLRVPSNIEKGKYRLLIHSYFLTQKSEKPSYFRCIEFDKVLNVR